MSNGNGYDHTNVEELLELALTRMAAGEGYADIIAAIPPENLDEFEGILQMVQDLEMLADVDVPRDPAAQAASASRATMEKAGRYRQPSGAVWCGWPGMQRRAAFRS